MVLLIGEDRLPHKASMALHIVPRGVLTDILATRLFTCDITASEVTIERAGKMHTFLTYMLILSAS